MCGIAGLVDLNGLDPAATQMRGQAALARLRMRGPDGEGLWSDVHCALVHTRLSILELSALGAQPMEREGLHITFNGEIFNFAQIREDLEKCGHRFRSWSDTEVLLAGWRQWGPKLLPRLIGMFAFAIWDPEEQALFAARDRFGEKPFLYSATSRKLAFGSDLIACEAMLGEQRAIDTEALRSLFTLRFVPEPASIAQGIQKLPAGHWLRFDRRGLAIERWYDLTRERQAAFGNLDDAEAALRDRFDAAVASRLVSDVPVGVFLSGGIDSALVAASVARAGGNLNTFTVGFEGASSYYEERPLAEAVARHLGACHTEIAVRSEHVRSALDRVFLALDEPFADASAVPTFLVAEATKPHVSVVLTGDGADEVFCGYRKYWSELYATMWSRVPGPLKQAVSAAVRILPEGKDHPWLEAVRRVRRFVTTADDNPARRQVELMRLTNESEIGSLLGAAGRESGSLADCVTSLRAESKDRDLINAMLYCDVALGLPGDMLTKVDRTSMAHALETRAPFLDQRVVELAFALPGSAKLGFSGLRPEGKRILRRAFRDRLPQEVFQRPKRGFEMPVAGILSDAAADRLEAATDERRLKRQGLFNPQVVSAWKSDLGTGRRDTSWQLWTILAFQEWARLHQRPEQL